MTASVASRLPAARRSRPSALRRAIAGPADQPLWIRPSLLGLLIATAVLYLWSLADSGTANSFYAAAVQAGSKSWKAWFFGSLDSSNFITVDKPPASLWVMGLSARIFGFSSWSLLAPQALMGVASVALVYGAVKRSLAELGARVSASAGLLAGAVLALTPAAALMFRFDNPDALLVLLMTAAAYAVVRALPKASWKWLALAGVALGFAFLTKMLQGLLVLPAFGVVYLIAAKTTLPRRLVHLAVAAAALVLSAGWWVFAVALWPADARPYIGGSTNNTVLDLVFGYNGLGRIFGGSGNGGGGSGTSGSSFGGATGLQRLFSSEMGLEVSWLLPAALLLLVGGLLLRGRAPRIDAPRAALLLWGGWLLVTGLVFSYMSGTVHPYYTVALAPAIGALVGIGGALAWRGRARLTGRLLLAGGIVAATGWGFVLLVTNTSATWLAWLLLAGGLLSAAAILASGLLAGTAGRRMLATAVLAGTVFGLTGTGISAVATAAEPHSGSIPTVSTIAETSSTGGMGGGGGMGGPGGSTNGGSSTSGRPSGSAPSGTKGGTPPSGAMGGSKIGSRASGSTTSGSSTATASGATGQGGAQTTTSSAVLTALLKKAGTTWSAAVNGSQSAATLELSSGTAVMAIGGWSSDPAPTLAQFEAYVKAGKIHYYISSGSGQGGGGGSTASAIQQWVASHYTARTVGGTTVYDLTAAK